MAERVILEWQWDDGNIAYLGRRGLSRKLVRQVALGAPRLRRNLKGRAATHLMIGRDDGGQIWTICIVEVTNSPGVWRAFNGWPSDDEEKAWYNRYK
ncbi:MAG: hypothetical protein H0U92_09320 [Actinobacteria bacterium]|nr:hypothetical protein [Actinomycetota bacterium]